MSCKHSQSFRRTNGRCVDHGVLCDGMQETKTKGLRGLERTITLQNICHELLLNQSGSLEFYSANDISTLGSRDEDDLLPYKAQSNASFRRSKSVLRFRNSKYEDTGSCTPIESGARPC